MRIGSAWIALPLALVVAGCGSSGGLSPDAPTPSTASASSSATATSAAPAAAPKALSDKATCDRLVGNGDEALGLRVADYTVRIMNSVEIEGTAYRSAKDLTDEFEELADIADPRHTGVIKDLAAGPQAVVDAVGQGADTFDIPAQAMMGAALDAGEACLSGAALNEYALALSARLVQLPTGYGGGAQEPVQCVRDEVVDLAAGEWYWVVASRGTAEHREWIEEFYDTVSAQSEDSASWCLGNVEIASLTFEASVLQVGASFDGEASGGQYEEVYDAFTAWLEAIGRTDVELIAP